jgi:hypothetical protein
MGKRSKRRWRDLTPRQQRAIAIAGAVQVGLQVAALADLRRRAAGELHGGKPLWVALSFVNFAGPLAYFAFGRRR